MSQLDYSVTLGKETTYGVPVAPTRSFETEANFKADLQPITGSGMRPTKRVARLRRDSIARRVVTGDIAVDANTKGLGYLLNAAMGVVNTTLVSGGLYQQVHTLRRDDPVDSYTIQELLPFIGGGAMQPHTFTGCVCDTLDLEVKEGAYVSLKTGWTGRDLSTSASASAAAYTSGDDLYSSVHAAISLGGTLTPPTSTALATMTGSPRTDVVDFSLSLKNNLDDKGRNLTGGGLRSRKPVFSKQGEVSGSLTAEYTDNVLRDAYLAQTALPLLLTLTNGTAVLQVALASVRLRGEVPASNGGEPISVTVPFMAFDDDTAAEPLWVVYRSTDTAP